MTKPHSPIIDRQAFLSQLHNLRAQDARLPPMGPTAAKQLLLGAEQLLLGAEPKECHQIRSCALSSASSDSALSGQIANKHEQCNPSDIIEHWEATLQTRCAGITDPDRQDSQLSAMQLATSKKQRKKEAKRQQMLERKKQKTAQHAPSCESALTVQHGASLYWDQAASSR